MMNLRPPTDQQPPGDRPNVRNRARFLLGLGVLCLIALIIVFAVPGEPFAGQGGGDAPAPAPARTRTSGGADAAQVLHYSIPYDPKTIDPQQMSFVPEIGTGQLVFEGLLELDKNLQPVPAAAEQMEVSPDGLKYTLTVREGLKYSDGTPLTAKNFEYAWKRLLDPRVPNRQYSFTAYDIVGAKELDSTPITDTAKIAERMAQVGIKATDDRHIEFTLKNRASYFPYVLTLWVGWPVRQDLVEQGGDAWTTDPAGRYYIGNGPFVLADYQAGQSMTFRANPHYRLGKPQIAELHAQVITDSRVAFQAYKNGELDVLPLAAEDYSTAQGDPELQHELITLPGSCNFYLGFNLHKPPFDNIRVRQAFAQALNRQDYVDNVMQGQGKVALSFIPPDRPGYAPDIQLWAFNPAAAQQTLAAAGYPKGQGLPEIKLTYANNPRNRARMEWVQNQARVNLGVTITLEPVEAATFSAMLDDPAAVPAMYMLGWCQDYPDPQDWLSLVFHSSSRLSYSGWQNPQFDLLVRQADSEPDPTRRLALYHQAQEILVREVPVVFLYWEVRTWLIKPYVQGMREAAGVQDLLIPGFIDINHIKISPH